jgi:ABC-type polysaccharide/polyol phosphate export permease
MLPPAIAQWFALNPMSAFLGAIRAPLLGMPGAGLDALLAPALCAAATLAAGLWVFRRLQRHLEDFL